MSGCASPPAWNERERLAALDSYEVLDMPVERSFDDVVRLTAQLLDAPVAAGFDHHLAKPVSLPQLEQLLAEVSHHRRRSS